MKGLEMGTNPAMLLRLPLCPKCGDTKNVFELPYQRLDMSTTQYACTVCKVRWCTNCGSELSHPIRGTIEDLEM